MSIIPFLLLPLGEYLLVSGAALAFLLLCLKQKMNPIVLFVWLAPICVWLTLALIKDSGTLTNLIVEPLILAVAVALAMAAWIGVATGSGRNTKAAGIVAVLAVLTVAVCVRIFTPAFPE